VVNDPMSDIVVLGNFVVDLIGKPIDRLPDRGRLLLIDTLETHPGGNGPNTSGALGKLGADVTVLGRVGEDLYGRFLTERLDGWGVRTDTVIRDPNAVTGLTLVPVDSTGERSFIHHYGANADFSPEDVDWDRLLGARHFHLAGFFVLPRFEGAGAAKLLAEARRRGMTTSLDVCWDRTGRWMEALRPCLPHLDWVMPSEEEAQQITGCTEAMEICAVLRDAGAGAVVLKLGERGCVYAGEEGLVAVPAYDVPVRETTGAGDCFIAGFLYAQLEGWELQRALRFANACGARAVTAVGAVTGMATAAEIEEWASRLPARE
jgi:sugar/nucleoside kinase (ribokinase family)